MRVRRDTAMAYANRHAHRRSEGETAKRNSSIFEFSVVTGLLAVAMTVVLQFSALA